MKRGTGKLLIIGMLSIFPLCAFSARVHGHGFNIYDQGGKAFGMGEAFVALADDPSAIFYNPAGITQLRGTQVYSGLGVYMPGASFRSAGNSAMGSSPGAKTRAVSNTYVVPHTYLTHAATEKVSFGVGVFSPFGLGREWPDGWEGRFSGSAIKSELSAITVNPVVALKLSDRLSFGFGPLVQNFEARYMNNIFLSTPTPPYLPGSNVANTAMVQLKGKSIGYGWNSGALLRVTDRIRFGISYMSRVTHNMTNAKQEITLSGGTVLKRQDAHTTVVLPAIGKVGVAFTPGRWVFEVDAEWIEWSTYNHSRIRFADGTTAYAPKNWHDSWTWHFGTQYTVNPYLDLRTGFAYGQTPVPRSTLDPLVTGGNRMAYFLGFGTRIKKVKIDVGYIYTRDTNRTWDNSAGNVAVNSTTLTQVKGRFVDNYCHSIGISAGYTF